MPSRSPAARILVVEDDSTIALGLKMLLEDWGHNVIGISASGEMALAMAASDPPDLVLMDVQLDGRLDGIETAAALRFQHTMPILFLTAQSDPRTVARLASSEAATVLLKPVEPPLLRSVVERLAPPPPMPAAAARMPHTQPSRL